MPIKPKELGYMCVKHFFKMGGGAVL